MNKYTKQGEDFLRDTNTTLEIVECVPQKSPFWVKENERYGINYSVTLKNARHSYTFDFWGSIADREILEKAHKVNQLQSTYTPLFFFVSDYLKKETGQPLSRLDLMTHKGMTRVSNTIKPTAYDILACLDTYGGDSFEDFCANYGYDEDSRTAEKTYHAVQEQQNNLRKLFTHDELEKLNEIQ